MATTSSGVESQPLSPGGVRTIEPTVYSDPRSFFFESYNRAVLSDLGIEAEFVQDNHSGSKRGVLLALIETIAITIAGWSIFTRLSDVSVRFHVPKERVGTFKEHVIRAIQCRSVGYREFWPLSGIDLSVADGETLGIIGRNWAGKSTLLKVISRIICPTRGRVWVRGMWHH